MGCDKCDNGFVFFTCCSGIECYCMGRPVSATNCKVCNQENKDPDDKKIASLLEYIEWHD